VRVGRQVVAVSVGDGGVHRLFDLDDNEVSVPQTVGSSDNRGLPAAGFSTRPSSPLDFKTALKGALKTAGLAVLFAIAMQATPARSADAQGATLPRPGAASRTQTAQPSAATSSVARTASGATATQTTSKLLDTPVSKLGPQMDLRVGGGAGSEGLRLSGTVGVVVMMGLLTMLPMLLLMMTGFTRILIVLNFLKQALGTQSAPPTQLVAGLALLLTGFVMAPTLTTVNTVAITPWMDGQIDQATMLKEGSKPFREFMLRQTRKSDLETFVRMSGGPRPATREDIPLVTLTSAYVISELRTAFQIGFALFLPFIVIDVAVSSVLMSMGMFMLPPAMISLPFKLLLFVLVDGWSLIVQSLVTSFR